MRKSKLLEQPDRIYTLLYRNIYPSGLKDEWTEIDIEAYDYEEAKEKLKELKGEYIELSNLNPIKFIPILHNGDIYKIKNIFTNLYDYYKIVGIGKDMVSLARYADNQEYMGFERKNKEEFINMLINQNAKHIDSLKENLINESKQEQQLVSNGIYSVLKDKWIKEPIQQDIPEIDQKAFNELFNIWKERYDKLLSQLAKEVDYEEKEKI